MTFENNFINHSKEYVFLDNETLLTTPTEKRGVVMVFQNYLLFPYMNVNENVGFALKMKGMPPKSLNSDGTPKNPDEVQLSKEDIKRGRHVVS